LKQRAERGKKRGERRWEIGEIEGGKREERGENTIIRNFRKYMRKREVSGNKG
jgi:hypothetical protein